MRAAIYVRQSIENDEGIERGLLRARALVATRGWESIHEYTDNGASASKSRQGRDWSKMLDAIRRGEIDVVVGIDMDRLLRDVRDLITLIDLGVKVVTVDGEIDLASADGELRATILASIARFEIRRKGERQRRANEHRVSTGRPVPGRRRFGYETDGTTLRPEESDLVRLMFRAFHGGASIRSIMLDLKANYPAPGTGVEWTPRRVRDTLNNPAYGGEIRHKGKTLPGVVAPVVDREHAAEVRLMLADPSRRTTPGSAVKHLMSNVALCGVCGKPLIFMRSYICKAAPAHVSILKPLLDPVVRGEVIAALQFGHANMFDNPTGLSLSALMASYDQNAASVEETLQREDSGLLTPPAARARLTKLKVEREAIERSLAQARTASAGARVLVDLRREVMKPGRVDMDGVVHLRGQIADRFDSLDIDAQRELVRSLLRVTVHKGRTADRIEIEHLVVTALNEMGLAPSGEVGATA